MSSPPSAAAKLFQTIYKRVKETFTQEMMNSIRTKSGDTQKAERIYISEIRKILTTMKLTFTEAGSQQPFDFRVNIPDSDGILKLEAKKTDSFSIYFNDTCPSDDSFYIIFFTGKIYKRKEDIPSKIIGVNGSEFIEQCPWIEDYKADLEILKQKYAGCQVGPMSVYPRPTFKSDIKFLL